MFRAFGKICLLLLIFFVTLLSAQKSIDSIKGSIGEKFLEAGKKYLGVPFVWGGRSKEKLDCMGLPFLAYTDVTGKRWQELSVFPAELVKSEKLGKPVAGLDGILKDSIDYSKFQKGDIIYFLVLYEIGEVKNFTEIDSIPYWVWHMGIYAGVEEKPLVLNARPGDKVVIEPLEEIYFDAVFVTRLDGSIDYPSPLSSPTRGEDSFPSNRIESREEIVKNLQKLMANNQPVVIYTIVALCDNEHQGIVPVSPKLGNGEDPTNNLYWGAGGGVKTYFKKSKQWRMVANYPRIDTNAVVLERCVFKHKSKNVYLLADAYRGSAIKEAITDFLNAVAGNYASQVTISADDSSFNLEVGSQSHLFAYVGHNGLLDFSLDSIPEPVANNRPKDVIILACLSKSSFYDILDSLDGYPLLWTTGLFAPEAYTLKAAIDGWIELESGEEILSRSAKAYNKFQKCGLNTAKKLFATGW